VSLKKQSEFESRNDYVDYLFEQCQIGLSRELIYGRIQRNWNPERAITEPKIKKPGRDHPYKKQYRQNQS
jgi:hypothetical protein